MQYQCNNTFEIDGFHYNLSEIISEEEYRKLPNLYRKWFTEVGRQLHFYCQNLCGDVDFSIDEWNKAFDEVKDMSEEIRRMVLDKPPACKEQCFSCIAIIGEQRKKTENLTGKPENSTVRQWYLDWKAKGKPTLK